MSSRFRLITFDVTNTLLRFRSSPGKQYGEIGALFGVVCNNNELVKNYKANWYKMCTAYPNFGRDSRMEWQEWWRQLITSTFNDSGAKIPQEKMENCANHLVEMFKTSICWQHSNGSIELLNYLRMQQQLAVSESTNNKTSPFVLGVISNFDPRLDTLLRNLKINHYFEFALNSYDCRAEKPAPEIFELAMRASELHDLKPAQCLHIGDGPSTDFMGARAAGWSAALVHEQSPGDLIDKYGDKIEEHFVFPSLFDFRKKFSNNVIDW